MASENHVKLVFHRMNYTTPSANCVSGVCAIFSDRRYLIFVMDSFHCLTTLHFSLSEQTHTHTQLFPFHSLFHLFISFTIPLSLVQRSFTTFLSISVCVCATPCLLIFILSSRSLHSCTTDVRMHSKVIVLCAQKKTLQKEREKLHIRR